MGSKALRTSTWNSPRFWAEALENRVVLASDVGNGPEVRYVPNEYTLALNMESLEEVGRDAISLAIEDVVSEARGRINFEKFFLGKYAKIKTSDGVTFEEVIERFQNVPGFDEVLRVPYGFLAVSPNDTKYSDSWHLEEPSDDDIDFDNATDYVRGWAGVTSETGTGSGPRAGIAVAVIDTGIDTDHPDIDANIWKNPGEIAGDGIDNDGNGYTDDIIGWDYIGNGVYQDNDPYDMNGHGTAVAGVIAAETDNNLDVAGAAWNVSIISLRIGGTDPNDPTVSFGAAAEAIEYIIDLKQYRGINVPVINMSIEGPAHGPLQTAITLAKDRGIICVAAAGNGGLNLDTAGNEVYPAEYTDANLITVGGIDKSGVRVYNYSTTSVDIAAPAKEIWTLEPTEADVNDNVVKIDGTSFAAPLVSAVVASLYIVKPEASTTEIRDWILDAADTDVTPTGQIAGNRRLNYYESVNDMTNGAGVTSFVQNAAVTGTHTNDTLTNGNDTILVEVVSSNLRIKVNGTTKFDEPLSEVQAIVINGLAGNDTITASNTISKRMIINGSVGNDSILSESGNDLLIGGHGNDTLTGDLGNDRLYGLSGDDSLYGSGDDDTLVGDPTSDLGSDRFEGDSGIDVVDYSGYDTALIADIDGTADDGISGEADNIQTNVEKILGGAQADSLTGSSANNFLKGNGGNDTIRGDSGSDTIDGNSGNDRLYGGNDADTLNGHDGNDTIQGDAGADSVLGEAGTDDLEGNDNNDTVIGGTGADNIKGNGGDDSYRAEDGTVDTIDGGTGWDLFYTISGSDKDVDRTSEGDSVTDSILNMDN